MGISENTHQAFHRGTAPVFALLTDEQTRQLAELQADPTLADRLSELAGKANEADLSPSERAEYEAYIEANNLLATLQAEARFRLSSHRS
jgi:hypothetical protein